MPRKVVPTLLPTTMIGSYPKPRWYTRYNLAGTDILEWWKLEENWHAWWDAAAADPALAGHVAERARRRVEAGHHVSESTLLATHVEALRAAGFAEVGTLWQRGDNRVLCAVMPGETA